MLGETTFICEDFVTPGYTIDTLKLERFIKKKSLKKEQYEKAITIFYDYAFACIG